MSDASYSFDSSLNRHQLYDSILPAQANQCVYKLGAYRYDTVQAAPRVDLILYDEVNDKLLVAIGLPLLRDVQSFAKLVWPEIFQGLQAFVLHTVTVETLGQLNGAEPEVGKLYPVQPMTRVFGAEFSDLIDERCCPGVENHWVVTQHMKRYAFVADKIDHGRVLDVASGSGYGASMILSKQPGVVSYTGADYDDIAIGLARKFNGDPRAFFHHGDFAAIDAKFDWVVSLETIEHVPDPDAFLEGLKSKLVAGGKMLISLPSERWHGSHINRYHWSSWNFNRFRSFLSAHFNRVEYFYYKRPTFDESPFDINTIYPIEAEIDVSTHEGYLAILSELRPDKRTPRLVLRRKHATGDVLLATPVLKALRQKYPQYRIVVWTDATEVFADNPDADLVMCGWSGFQPNATDILINLDEAYEREPHLHILAAYAKAAGIALPNPRLGLYLAAIDYRLIQQVFDGRKDKFEPRRLVAVHMSTTHDRTWPKDYWDTLLQMLLSDPDLGIMVLGAGNDAVAPHHFRIVNLVGRLDLRGTAAAIAVSDMLIGMDSSLLHVAGAVGTPAIGLYGLADPDKRAPLDSAQTAVQADVPCAGCLHELVPPNTDPRCRFGPAFCNDEITPNLIYKAAINCLDYLSPLSWQVRLALGGALPYHLTTKAEGPVEQTTFSDKIRYYEQKLEQLSKQHAQEIGKLRGDLAWFESNLVVRLLRRAKRLIK
jgi:ADP-heptose:LPS heptosyltransferase